MRVLITGSAGMLGSAVYPAFVRAGHQTTATDLTPRPVGELPMDALDVRDFQAVGRTMDRVGPELVLHLAAETDLEICQSDPDHAYRTNTVGTQNVAVACQQRGLPLVYVSTAGVFDGEKGEEPYTEFDAPRPINVYGDSKYQGERLVQSLVPRHYVIRAGWMIGGADRDHKFVAKVADQLKNGAKTIYAVTDKLGTPTYTEDFARNLLALLQAPYYGLYHMACGGRGSRWDVARELLDYYGRDDVRVEPVNSDFFAETYPAPRPHSEMMRNYMLELHGLNQMRPWQEALRDYLDHAGFRF
jgi:dTDP-4-dehydrorhamnose reductase